MKISILERGSASVEFAILLPFMAFLIVGSADIVRIVTTGISLESAVRMGTTAGASLLNQPGVTITNADKDIGVPTATINTMRQIAAAEAPNGATINVATYCRCPPYDYSEPGNSALGACMGVNLIRNCVYGAEVFFEMTATSQLDLFWDFFGLPGSYQITRRALVAAY